MDILCKYSVCVLLAGGRVAYEYSSDANTLSTYYGLTILNFVLSNLNPHVTVQTNYTALPYFGTGDSVAKLINLLKRTVDNAEWASSTKSH